MPQCDFFLSEADEDRVVWWILSSGAWIAPDLDYSQPKHDVVRTADAYWNVRNQTNLFFILHESFYRCPLELRVHSSGPKAGRFFLMQRNGGPALSFFCPRVYEKGESKCLPAGMLAYYPTYRNTARAENEKTPKELVRYFREVTAVIQDEADQRTVGSRIYWIGKDAKTRFRDKSLRPGMDIWI